MTTIKDLFEHSGSTDTTQNPFALGESPNGPKIIRLSNSTYMCVKCQHEFNNSFLRCPQCYPNQDSDNEETLSEWRLNTPLTPFTDESNGETSLDSIEIEFQCECGFFDPCTHFNTYEYEDLNVRLNIDLRVNGIEALDREPWKEMFMVAYMSNAPLPINIYSTVFGAHIGWKAGQAQVSDDPMIDLNEVVADLSQEVKNPQKFLQDNWYHKDFEVLVPNEVGCKCDWDHCELHSYDGDNWHTTIKIQDIIVNNPCCNSRGCDFNKKQFQESRSSVFSTWMESFDNYFYYDVTANEVEILEMLGYVMEHSSDGIRPPKYMSPKRRNAFFGEYIKFLKPITTKYKITKPELEIIARTFAKIQSANPALIPQAGDVFGKIFGVNTEELNKCAENFNDIATSGILGDISATLTSFRNFTDSITPEKLSQTIKSAKDGEPLKDIGNLLSNIGTGASNNIMNAIKNVDAITSSIATGVSFWEVIINFFKNNTLEICSVGAVVFLFLYAATKKKTFLYIAIGIVAYGLAYFSNEIKDYLLTVVLPYILDFFEDDDPEDSPSDGGITMESCSNPADLNVPLQSQMGEETTSKFVMLGLGFLSMTIIGSPKNSFMDKYVSKFVNLKFSVSNLSTMLTTILEYVTDILQWLLGDMVDKLNLSWLVGKNDIDVYLDKVEVIHREWDANKYITSEANYIKVLSLLKEGELILRSLPRTKENSGTIQVLTQNIAFMNKLREFFTNTHFQFQGLRQEPTHTYVCGAPGNGKSYINSILPYDVLQRTMEPEVYEEFKQSPNSFIYQWNPLIKYWEGYSYTIDALIGEELEGKKDTGNAERTHATDLLWIYSSFQAILEMGTLALKGKVYMLARHIFSNGNQKDFDIQSMSTPSAFVRRIDFMWVQYPKKEYELAQDATSMTSYSKDTGELVVNTTRIDEKDYMKKQLDKSKLPIDEVSGERILKTEYFNFIAYDPLTKCYGKICEYEEIRDAHVERYFTKKKRFEAMKMDIERRRAEFDERTKKEAYKDIKDLPMEPQGRFDKFMPDNFDPENSGDYTSFNIPMPEIVTNDQEQEVWQTFIDGFNEFLDSYDPSKNHGTKFLVTNPDINGPGKLTYLSNYKAALAFSYPLSLTNLYNILGYFYIEANGSICKHNLKKMRVDIYKEKNSFIKMYRRFGPTFLYMIDEATEAEAYIWADEVIYESFQNVPEIEYEYTISQSYMHQMKDMVSTSKLELASYWDRLINSSLVRKLKGWLTFFYPGMDTRRVIKHVAIANGVGMFILVVFIPIIGMINRIFGPKKKKKKTKVLEEQSMEEQSVNMKNAMKLKHEKGKSKYTTKEQYQKEVSSLKNVLSQIGFVDPAGREKFESIRRRNMYEIAIQEYWGVFDSYEFLGYTLFVQGTVAAMPRHFITKLLKGVQRNEKVARLRIRLRRYSDKCEVLEHICEVRDIISPDKLDIQTSFERDLAYVCFPKTFGIHMSIVKWMPTIDDLHADRNKTFNAVLATNGLNPFNGQRICEWAGVATYTDKIREVHPTDGDVYTVRLGYTYPANTTKGDCGAALFNSNPKEQTAKLFGMHVGGDVLGQGFAAAFIKEEVIESLSKFPNVNTATLVEVGNLIEVEKDNLVLEPQDALTDEQWQWQKIAKPKTTPHMHNSTKLKKTLIFECLAQSTKAPAMLKRTTNSLGQVIDPWENAAKKFHKNKVYIEQSIVDSASRNYWDYLRRNSNMPLHEIQIFSFETAVQGLIDDPYFKSVNKSTSNGFPFNVMKMTKAYFFGAEGFDFEKKEAKWLKALVYEMLDAIRMGKRPLFPYFDTLKDELLKLSKVEEGKTRMFSACNFAMLILFRMYFGSFLRNFTMNMINNGSAIGINPYDKKQWTGLGRRLSKFEDHQGRTSFAGDQKEFDVRENPQILFGCSWVIQQYYLQAFDKNDELFQIQEMLFYEITNSIHLFRGELVMWFMSLPSGNPLTAMVNTMYHHILVRICWVFANGDNEDSLWIFEENVYIIVLGDDIAGTVSIQFRGIFNESKLADYMRRAGHEFQPETKEDELNPEFRPLKDIQFLKRTWRWDFESSEYEAPLVDETIMNMINYMDENSSYKDFEQVCNSVARELSLHGEEKFNKYVPILDKAITENYNGVISLKSTSFETVHNQVCNEKFSINV